MTIKKLFKIFYLIFKILVGVIIIGVVIGAYVFYQKYVYGKPDHLEKLKGAEQIEIEYHKAYNEHASISLNTIYDRNNWFFEKVTDSLWDYGVQLSPDKKAILFGEVEKIFINPTITISVYDLEKREKKVIYRDNRPHSDVEWLADSTVYIPKFIRIDKDGKIIDDKSNIAKFAKILPNGEGILYSKNNQTYILYHLDRTEETFATLEKPLGVTAWSPKGDYIIFEDSEEKEEEFLKYYYKYDISNKKLTPFLTIKGPYFYYSLEFTKVQGFPEYPNAFWINDGEKIKINLDEDYKLEVYEPSMIEIEKYHVENGIWTKIEGSGSKITEG